MPATPVVYGHTSLKLKSAPINPDWILDGEPEARNAVLSNSRDRMACTLVWDCTPGKFVWHYDVDETIHVLEGSIVLDDGVAPSRRLGSGDVVFFPKGAVVNWTVETHVRKLAFFRRTLPAPVGTVIRAARKLRTMLRQQAGPAVETSAPSVAGASMLQRAE